MCKADKVRWLEEFTHPEFVAQYRFVRAQS